jgi:hypothetical protein
MAVSPDRTRAAVGLRGGRVYVDVRQRRIVAQAAGQGMSPMVAWAARSAAAAPLLLVAGGGGLNAFQAEASED